MKIGYLFLILFVYSLHYPCLAQNTFEKDLKTCKDDIKGRIVPLLKNETLYNGITPTNISILVIPFCVFRPDKIKNEDLARFSITIDTSFKMTNDSFSMTNELLYWNHILYSLPMPRRGWEESNFTSIEYSDWQFMKGRPDITMIDTAQKYSKNCFYLKLLSRDAEGNVPLAFVDHGEIHLIDRGLNVYSSIKEFINTKYGCVDKYLEMVKNDENRIRLSKYMSVDKAKAILRSDFVLWWDHHREDTLGVLTRFFNQMDSMVHLKAEQRKLLESKINNDITAYLPCTCSSEIVLMGRDLRTLILSVLTDDQYIKYIQGRNDAIWLNGKAVIRLDNYYLLERKIPIEKENEIMNAEIFDPK